MNPKRNHANLLCQHSMKRRTALMHVLQTQSQPFIIYIVLFLLGSSGYVVEIHFISYWLRGASGASGASGAPTPNLLCFLNNFHFVSFPYSLTGLASIRHLVAWHSAYREKISLGEHAKPQRFTTSSFALCLIAIFHHTDSGVGLVSK